MQQPAPKRAVKDARAKGKEHEDNRRWEREGGPSGETPEIAGAHESKGEQYLAAGGTREELAQADQIGKGRFIEPASTNDEFRAVIADMGDRAAKTGQPELQADEQDFQGRAGLTCWHFSGIPGGDTGGRLFKRRPAL